MDTESKTTNENVIPLELIPDGWYLFRVGYSKAKKGWSANLHDKRLCASYGQVAGYGNSPRAAVLNAVENLKVSKCRKQ